MENVRENELNMALTLKQRNKWYYAISYTAVKTNRVGVQFLVFNIHQWQPTGH